MNKMNRHFQDSGLLNSSFNTYASDFCFSDNVVPLLYPQKKNPRKLFTCKGYHFVNVGATGFEPVTPCL